MYIGKTLDVPHVVATLVFTDVVGSERSRPGQHVVQRFALQLHRLLMETAQIHREALL